jgi:hypothetical protein
VKLVGRGPRRKPSWSDVIWWVIVCGLVVLLLCLTRPGSPMLKASGIAPAWAWGIFFVVVVSLGYLVLDLWRFERRRFRD